MKKIVLIGLTLSSLAIAKNKSPEPMPQNASPQATAQVAYEEIEVGVKGMVCAFCAQGIEKTFLKQAEVSKVEVSLENKYVKLKFKEGKTLSKEKIAEILKEAGYESVFGK